jgi:hypothetical protein
MANVSETESLGPFIAMLRPKTWRVLIEERISFRVRWQGFNG